MKIVLINGSPAKISHTSSVLAEISNSFQGYEHTCIVVHLKDVQLPYNDPEYHADASLSPDEKVRQFAHAVQEADVVVLGTPLYHGSFSGLLKTALDNLDGDAFEDKIIVIASNAGGVRNAMQAAQELVVVARTMRAQVNNRLIGTCKSDFELVNNEYKLINEDIIARIQSITDGISTGKSR